MPDSDRLLLLPTVTLLLSMSCETCKCLVLLCLFHTPVCHPRWASQADVRPVRKASNSQKALGQGPGSSKRAKPGPALEPDDDHNGLTAGLDRFFGKTQGDRGMRDNAKTTRGVLKKVMPAF